MGNQATQGVHDFALSICGGDSGNQITQGAHAFAASICGPPQTFSQQQMMMLLARHEQNTTPTISQQEQAPPARISPQEFVDPKPADGWSYNPAPPKASKRELANHKNALEWRCFMQHSGPGVNFPAAQYALDVIRRELRNILGQEVVSHLTHCETKDDVFYLAVRC